MAFLSDCSSIELAEFCGAWIPSPSLIDPTKIAINKGRLSRNVSFFGQNVATRYGYSAVFNPAASVTSMINWLFLNGTTPANYLAFYVPGTGVRIANLASPTASTLIAETTGTTASLCSLGKQMYAGFMDANGIGVAPGKVCAFGGTAEPLFAAPIATVPTLSEPLGPAAITTIGAKNFGYLIQTSNGFITRPSPAPTDVFTPVSYTSTGGIIEMSISPPSFVWPTYAVKVAMIATTTANPNRYFIVPSPSGPGNSAFVAVSAVAATKIYMNVSDSYLAENGIDATAYLTQLSQTVSLTAPINPSVIAPYGQRLAYQCLDSAGTPVTYFSDSSQPQSLNAANSAVYLPGNLSTTTGFALRETFYILGPHWTYAVTDSNDTPSTWAQPQLVDGAIGAIGPFCVSLNATMNFAWVADEAGLYLFQGGSYSSRPVSYWQTTDWQRINFAATTKIQVVDHKSNQRVVVLAPLDGASTPTHQLTFDYSLGLTPELIQYSINSIASYSSGAIAMVQNNTTKHVEPWIAPSSSAYSIIRENDGTEANPYRDVSAAIDSAYEYAPLPRGFQGNVIMHHGLQIRVRGAGTATLTMYSVDQVVSAGPFSLTLATAPDAEILQRFFIRSEYASGRMATNAVDEWFNLARIDHYFTPGSPSR
jgi:hypothetical protein